MRYFLQEASTKSIINSNLEEYCKNIINDHGFTYKTNVDLSDEGHLSNLKDFLVNNVNSIFGFTSPPINYEQSEMCSDSRQYHICDDFLHTNASFPLILTDIMDILITLQFPSVYGDGVLLLGQ